MPFQCFQFRRHVVGPILVPPLVEGNDSQVVTPDEERFVFYVIESERENAV